MSLIIRAATAADVPTIARFNAAMAWETEGLKLDRERLRRGVEAVLADPNKGFYWVAELDGRPAGQMLVTPEWSDWRNGAFWWIQSVYMWNRRVAAAACFARSTSMRSVWRDPSRASAGCGSTWRSTTRAPSRPISAWE